MQNPEIEAYKAPTVTEAVRLLRRSLGDTQQQFAQRLGMAISTVVRYESTRPPRGKVLAKLYQLAIDNGLSRVASMFHLALSAELGESPIWLRELHYDLLQVVRSLEAESNPTSMVSLALFYASRALETVESRNPFPTASQDPRDLDAATKAAFAIGDALRRTAEDITKQGNSEEALEEKP
jgi:transcriptional regulator with XRE-family HTH domain